MAQRESLWWDPAVGAWIAADPATVRDVLEHPALRVRPPAVPVPPALEGTVAGEIFRNFARMNDGERHRRLRAAVTAALETLPEERVVGTTWALLAASDPMPTLHELQVHVPARVMATLLGVSPERSASVVEWTRAFVRAAAPDASDQDMTVGISAAEHLFEVFDRAPRVGSLDGTHLSREEWIATAIGCLFQTHDATAGLIGNAIVALGRGADPADVGALVRHVARHDAPVQSTRRFAATDVVIGDAPVRAGDLILVVLAAANRDDPDVAWSFGHGPHRCPGDAIALAIAEVAVTFAQRHGLVPQIVDGTIAFHPSANARIPDLRGLDRSDTQEART